jgi:hypothetical protein
MESPLPSPWPWPLMCRRSLLTDPHHNLPLAERRQELPAQSCSEASAGGPSVAAPSPAFGLSSTPSGASWITGTTTASPSSGSRPPSRSWPRYTVNVPMRQSTGGRTRPIKTIGLGLRAPCAAPSPSSGMDAGIASWRRGVGITSMVSVERFTARLASAL